MPSSCGAVHLILDMNMQIDLRKTKTICISMKRSIGRREGITRLLDGLGYERWSFFDGIEAQDPIEGCALSHIGVLDSHDFSEPLLVLEDDVQITPAYTDNIVCPNNTDALYLGYSWWAWDKDRAKQSNIPAPTTIEKIGDLYKISKMTSAHAVLYVSKEYGITARDSMKAYLEYPFGNKHCDVALAMLQERYNIFATPKHYFFQVCERNTFWTNKSIA